MKLTSLMFLIGLFSSASYNLSRIQIRKISSKSLSKFSNMALHVTTKSNTQINDTTDKVSPSTGIFKSLPNIATGPNHFKKALRSLKTIRGDADIKNLRNRQRKLTATSLDALMKGLTIPITNILNAYSTMLHDLHPYEAAVADLTVIARVKAGLPDLKVRITYPLQRHTIILICEYTYYIYNRKL